MRQLTASTRHRYAIGKVDAGGEVSYGNYFPYYNFFGLGNNTSFNEDQYDDRFYRPATGVYPQCVFWNACFLQRSVMRVGPTLRVPTPLTLRPPATSACSIPRPGGADIRPNSSTQRLLGLNAVFDLDLRDRQAFARRGVRLRAQHDTYRQLSGTESTFGLTQGFAEYYGTARLGHSRYAGSERRRRQKLRPRCRHSVL